MKLNLNGSSVWARIFLGLGLIGLVLVGATVYGSNCSGDVCIQKEIDQLRSEKDTYQSRINELNGSINDLKKGFSAGYVIEQIQTQHLQNVHPDILTQRDESKGFHLIPKAMAASGETMLDVPTRTSADNVSVRFAPDQISVGRYGEVLAELGSPFASVPIEKYCNQAEVKQDMCDILVGISFAESAAGTKFRKKDMATGKIVEANEEGKNTFNPVGLKGGGISYPTPEDWYLRPFKSWDDFWSFYPAHMKKAYIDRGGTTPIIISKCYVGGDCITPKAGWANRVESFVAKLN